MGLTASIQLSTKCRSVRAGLYQWTNTRNGQGAVLQDPVAQGNKIWAYTSRNFISNYWNYRCFVFIDLSSIAVGSTISAAHLKLWVELKGTESGPTDGFVITPGHQSDPVVAADYDPAAPWTQRDDNTVYGELNQPDITAGQYNNISFNAAGLTALEAAAGGEIKLCLRGIADNNDTGGTITAGKAEGIRFHTVDESGKEPSLEITDYAAPVAAGPGNVAHQLLRGAFI